MNFEKWYKQSFEYLPKKEVSKLGWDACKSEILKIIRENNRYNNEFCMLKLNDEEIIKEIEKL